VNIPKFACAASLVSSLVALSAQSTARPLLIRNVRVFDGERVFEGRDVWVENGLIARVLDGTESTASADIIEGRGRTLLPGLIDAHVHVPAVPDEALRQFADLGVTTVLDMFGGGRKLASKQRIVAEHLPGLADLRVAGFGATAPGSILGKMALQSIPSIDRPDQAQAWVDARIAEGSDYIKVIDDEAEGGRLDQETIEAIVLAAHRRGKLAVAHVLSEQKAREAIAAGMDGLAHLFIGDAASSDFGQFAASHHVFVVPTLMILRTLCGESDGRALLEDPRLAPFIPADQRPALTRAPSPERSYLCKGTNDALHQLVAAHVPILVGTDTMPPGQVGAFAVTGYGATLHAELKLLVDQGMNAVEALTAATAAPARAFGLTDRGQIRPGMRADLLLVDGNPTQDILATRNVVDVWTRGVRVDRAR
jgi:imidazolonepropionase-like amidohydrolase